MGLVACEGPGDEVALRFDGATMSLAEFEKELRHKGPTINDSSERDSLILEFGNGLLDKLVMAREARTNVRGDEKRLASEALKASQESVLEEHRARLFEELDFSDERMQEVYTYLGHKVRIRHILCETREEAEEIHGLLEGGADFVELVRERSKDAFSVQQGGELDWFGYGDVAGLDDAAYDLEGGEISEPVWTRRGWHVVRLDERQPRDRTGIDLDEELFKTHYVDKLKRQRWEEFLSIMWDTYEPTWDDETLELALVLHTDYRDRYAAMTQELQAVQDSGGPIPDYVRTFPRGPEPTDEQGKAVIITGNHGFTFTVEEASTAMWGESFKDRPDPWVPSSYRNWVRDTAMEYAAVFEARRQFPSKDPEMARAISDAEEFTYVQALYGAEVQRKTRVSADSLQAFFERHKDFYSWRPPLDLAVFLTKDEGVGRQIAAALEEGATAEEIEKRFAHDESLEVRPRTGLKSSFSEPEGLSTFVRGLGDESGAVGGPEAIAGAYWVVRIEEVGQPKPMTFEEAHQYVLLHCGSHLRELRARAFLDSLREEMSAELYDDVILKARIGSAEGGS